LSAITEMALPRPSDVRVVPSTGSTAMSVSGGVPSPMRSPLNSMGASSFSPSPITTMPSIDTVDSTVRIASTAAPSAPSLSPWPPTQPAPGFGGILLGAVVAAHVEAVPEDLWRELSKLVDDLQQGHRIAQPRLRHRFQTDVHGLDRSRHHLVGRGEELVLEID